MKREISWICVSLTVAQVFLSIKTTEINATAVVRNDNFTSGYNGSDIWTTETTGLLSSTPNKTNSPEKCKFLVQIDKENYTRYENGSVYIIPYQVTLDSFDIVNDTIVCLRINSSKELEQCGKDRKIIITPDLYKEYSNGSVYVEAYARLFDIYSHWKKRGTNPAVDNGIVVCQPPEAREDDDPTFGYISYIGTLISIICLALHLLVFATVPELRNLPGYCLASLSFALLVAYSCFLNIDRISSPSCFGISAAMYYFFASSYFWMTAISFELFRVLRLASLKLRSLGNTVSWQRFLAYSLYSWGFPGLMVTLSLIVDYVQGIPNEYKPRFGTFRCWFNEKISLLLFFAIPQFILILVNFGFFIASAVVICKHSMKSDQNSTALVRKFLLFVRLAIIMGLGWILGLVAAFANEVAVRYAYVIINTLQGLFIFAAFSFNRKVVNHYKRIFSKLFPNYLMSWKRKHGTSTNTSSSVIDNNVTNISLGAVNTGMVKE